MTLIQVNIYIQFIHSNPHTLGTCHPWTLALLLTACWYNTIYVYLATLVATLMVQRGKTLTSITKKSETFCQRKLNHFSGWHNIIYIQTNLTCIIKFWIDMGIRSFPHKCLGQAACIWLICCGDPNILLSLTIWEHFFTNLLKLMNTKIIMI